MKFFLIWPVRLSVCVVLVQPAFFLLFLFVFTHQSHHCGD